jgi:O-antigen/teichoic acid export membrane protein
LANLICSVLLATQMGIAGVALGTALPTTLTAFGYYLPTAARLLGIPLSKVLWRLAPSLALSCTALLAFALVIPQITFTSLIEFMIFAAVFVGTLVTLGITADREERATYVRALMSWLRPNRAA